MIGLQKWPTFGVLQTTIFILGVAKPASQEVHQLLPKKKIYPHLSPTRRSFNKHPLRAEILNAMESTIKWLPAFSRPFTFDVQKRIQQLRGYLDPKNPDYPMSPLPWNAKQAGHI